MMPFHPMPVLIAFFGSWGLLILAAILQDISNDHEVELDGKGADCIRAFDPDIHEYLWDVPECQYRYK